MNLTESLLHALIDLRFLLVPESALPSSRAPQD